MTMQKIHGESMPLWQKHGLKPVPPFPCEFSIGDKVIFTNDNGITFEMVVIGFAENDNFYGRFIHTIRDTWEGSAGWFPHHPSQLERILP